LSFAGDPSGAEAKGYRWTDGDRLEFDMTSGSRILAVTPVMFQRGWEAFVDGKRTDIFPADYIFIGLAVPPGEHHVVLTFEPPGLKTGLVLTALSGVFLVFLIASHGRRRKES